MEKSINFLEKELNIGKLLEEMKSANEEDFKQFVTSFATFYHLNFTDFVEFNHLNKYKFGLFLLGKSAEIFKIFNNTNDYSQQFQKNVLNILQILYFFHAAKFKFDENSSYFFSENVLEAIVVMRKLNPEMNSSWIFNHFFDFISCQHKMVVDRIQFEKSNIEITKIESFISDLAPQFILHFIDKEFIKPLIDYLYKEGYISKNGVWVEKPRKKTEIFGLVYALKELGIIDKDDANTRKDFHKTFKSSLSASIITSTKEPTTISSNAKMVFINELKGLYDEFRFSGFNHVSL